jgi:hypothetical protein
MLSSLQRIAFLGADLPSVMNMESYEDVSIQTSSKLMIAFVKHHLAISIPA